MLNFKYKALNHEGKEVIKRVSAEDLKKARSRLEALGYTNIRFLDDEFTATLNAETEEDYDFEDELLFSAEDEVKSQSGGLMGNLFTLIKYNLFAIIPLVMWVYFAATSGESATDFSDWVAYGVTGVYAIYAVGIGVPLLLFIITLNAKTWAKWTKVIILSRIAQMLPTVRMVKPIYAEFKFCEATAYGAQGDFEKALKTVAPLLEKKALNESSYYSHLSDMYAYSNDPKDQIGYSQLAYDLGSKSNTERISLTHLIAKYSNDIDRTEALLEEIEDNEITEMAESYVSLIKTLVALEKGNGTEANTHIEKALQQARPLEKIPLGLGHIFELKSARVWTLAALNRIDEAKNLYQDIKPFFEAHNDTYVINRSKQALEL